MGYYSRGSSWPKYVPVSQRKATAAKKVKEQEKKGNILNPITIEGRTIAKTFWGKAWCENLESYSDYSNRLPRGRTYARNGSIVDLQVNPGQIKAQVMGSSLYQISIEIHSMAQAKWASIIQACSGKIDSLIELLQGKFSKAVMEIITEKSQGLFPKPQEISMRCSCPDSASMCKHIAAVLYGIGASLDTSPERLFILRQVDHMDLIASASAASLEKAGATDVVFDDLSSLFDIEMDDGSSNLPIKEEVKKIIKQKPPKKEPIKRAVKTRSKKAAPQIMTGQITPPLLVPTKKKIVKKQTKEPSKRIKKPKGL